MKKIVLAFLILILTMCVTACTPPVAPETDGDAAAPVLSEGDGAQTEPDGPLFQGTQDGIHVFWLTPSSEGVEEFLADMGTNGPPSFYGDDACMRVTPAEILEEYGIAVYQYNRSKYSYLTYRGEIYSLEQFTGGGGIMSFAVADLNEDTCPEVYVCFATGSGISRTKFGFFDTATRGSVTFPFDNVGYHGGMFAVEDGMLCVYNADIVYESSSFYDIKLTPLDCAAVIWGNSTSISLRVE